MNLDRHVQSVTLRFSDGRVGTFTGPAIVEGEHDAGRVVDIIFSLPMRLADNAFLEPLSNVIKKEEETMTKKEPPDSDTINETVIDILKSPHTTSALAAALRTHFEAQTSRTFTVNAVRKRLMRLAKLGFVYDTNTNRGIYWQAV